MKDHFFLILKEDELPPWFFFWINLDGVTVYIFFFKERENCIKQKEVERSADTVLSNQVGKPFFLQTIEKEEVKTKRARWWATKLASLDIWWMLTKSGG